MRMIDAFGKITLAQVDQMICDFMRAFPEQALPRTATGPVCPGFAGREKHRIVAGLLANAQQAARKGEQERCRFMLGMAAAFYGLIRFAEAYELEEELGPRLGLSAPTGDIAESAGKPARKVTPVSDTQTQFKFEDMVAFFVDDGIRFASNEENSLVVAGFSGPRRGPIQLMAQVDEKLELMFLLFQLPMTVPEEQRVGMAEAITRANYGLAVGNFEMDMEDGDLNYKVAVPIDDAMLSVSQFRHCMRAALSIMDRYMPAFYRVVFGGVSAREAIEECED